MASPYEVEVRLSSASNLKNVNWRNGPNRPYAVLWVDPNQKRSTNVDQSGDTQANWDEKFIIPLPPAATVDESILFVDVFHAASEAEAKPILIGSARLQLNDVRNDVGLGERASRTLKLKRPSGRPHGSVDVRVVVRNTGYGAPRAYDASGYGVPPPGAQPTYGSSYGAAPPAAGYGTAAVTAAPYGSSYTAAPPTAGYGEAAVPTYAAATPTPTPTPYGSSYSAAPATAGYGETAAPTYAAATPTPAPYGSSYSAAPSTAGYGAAAGAGVAAAASYGQTGYGYGQAGQQSYGYGQSGQQNYGYGQQPEQKKSSKFGLGTGLVLGAVAGGIGALALEKGIDKVEDKIANRVAEKVEEDEYYEDDDEY